MSYDLRFAATAEAVVDDEHDDDENEWDDEESDDPPAPDSWERVVARAAGVLDDQVDGLAGADGELTHASGLQLIAYADRAEMSIPYHYADRAADVIRTLYGIAAIVEQELGLVGYDPQVDALTSTVEPDLRRPIEAYTRVASMFAR